MYDATLMAGIERRTINSTIFPRCTELPKLTGGVLEDVTLHHLLSKVSSPQLLMPVLLARLLLILPV